MASEDGKYHTPFCKSRKDHTDGKWCWSEGDVDSLEEQYGKHKTWNQIADSFKFHNAEGRRTCYRHHAIACHKKMDAILHGATGKATSIGLARLAKRPRTAKTTVHISLGGGRIEKQAVANLEYDGQTNAKDYNNDDDDDDNDKKDDKDDDMEADEAIGKCVIKMEKFNPE